MTNQTITTFGLKFTTNHHNLRQLHDKEHPLHQREIMVALYHNHDIGRHCVSDNVDPSELKEGWPEGVDVFIKEYNTYKSVENSPFCVSESFLLSGWKIPQQCLKDVIPEPKFGENGAVIKVPDMWFRDGYGIIHMNSWLIMDSFDMHNFKRGVWHLIGAPKTEALPR